MVPGDLRTEADLPAALYRRFGAVVYARCRRLLRDQAAAEDATQEVFLRVLRHLAQVPDDRGALAWIYRVSTNYCLNVLRDRAARESASAPVPAVAGQNPEASLERRDVVLRLVERAPEKLRAPAVLYYVDGLEQQQIAQILGLSRRTVINRLADFVVRSRKFLGRAGEVR